MYIVNSIPQGCDPPFSLPCLYHLSFRERGNQSPSVQKGWLLLLNVQMGQPARQPLAQRIDLWKIMIKFTGLVELSSRPYPMYLSLCWIQLPCCPQRSCSEWLLRQPLTTQHPQSPAFPLWPIVLLPPSSPHPAHSTTARRIQSPLGWTACWGQGTARRSQSRWCTGHLHPAGPTRIFLTIPCSNVLFCLMPVYCSVTQKSTGQQSWAILRHRGSVPPGGRWGRLGQRRWQGKTSSHRWWTIVQVILVLAWRPEV